ncbi:hypothetical protein L596_028084 [Steinernema carpocapsae]|uniref:Uncharacterized protein n=1 Tax=Steinernema carpocapsae TaxID=34508 RepID=A0A4U5LXG9_STECR|nr:hypothetical protein L596_028084 [Steinernema carpocapsae]
MQTAILSRHLDPSNPSNKGRSDLRRPITAVLLIRPSTHTSSSQILLTSVDDESLRAAPSRKAPRRRPFSALSSRWHPGATVETGETRVLVFAFWKCHEVVPSIARQVLRKCLVLYLRPPHVSLFPCRRRRIRPEPQIHFPWFDPSFDPRRLPVVGGGGCRKTSGLLAALEERRESEANRKTAAVAIRALRGRRCPNCSSRHLTRGS